MKFIKYSNIFGDGAINLSHIVELHIEAAFLDGEPLKNTWGGCGSIIFWSRLKDYFYR